MKKLYVLGTGIFFILFLYASNSFGQDDPDFAGFADDGINSPTAASLGKYGTIPVDLSTGVPSISIPLTEVTAGQLSLPVSLSYHAAGIKVTEDPSEVGLGWTLNAGGVITRVLRGHPDEVNTSTHSGYFHQLDNLDSFFGGDWTEDQRHDYLLEIARNKVDTEADVYSYNFAGKAGVMAIDGKGNFVTFPHVNLKVDYNHPSSFSITDDDGTRYHFNYEEKTERKYTDKESPGGGFPDGKVDPYYGTYTSAWYLTSIESPSQDQKITLGYESEPNSDVPVEFMSSSYFVHKIGYYDSGCSESSSTNHSYSKSYVPSFVRIKQIAITSSSGSTEPVVTFQYEGGGSYPLFYRLKNLQVREPQTQEIKKTVHFGYGSHQGDEALLKLNSVQEEYFNNDMLPPHEFVYNSGDVLARHTPDRDFMGYPTGSRGVNHLIGRYEPYGSGSGEPTYGVSREPSLNKTKAGVLKEIHYPTGGHTAFEYELNEAEIAGEIRPVGGLRVKKITNMAAETQAATVKEYQYGKGNVSSTIKRIVQYGFDRLNKKTYTNSSGNECEMEMGPSDAPSPLLGQPVRYDKVTEIIDGGNGGKVSESYFTYGGGSNDAVYQRSLPQVRQQMKSNDLVVRETSTGYNEVQPDTGISNQLQSIIWLRPELQLIPNEMFPSQNDTVFKYKSGLYKTLWAHPNLQSESQYEYTWIEGEDCDDPHIEDTCTPTEGYYEVTDTLETTTEYSYENSAHRQLTKKIRTNSTGEKAKTSYRYAHEEYPDMKSHHMLKQPYSTTVLDSTDTVLRKEWILWRNDNDAGGWVPDSRWEW